MKKEIEKIDPLEHCKLIGSDGTYTYDLDEGKIIKKINEIIDYINNDGRI